MQRKTEYPCGRLVIAGIPGTEMDRETERLIRDYSISNFIIFKRNADEGPEKLKMLCERLEEACADADLGKPIISVDQEGGTVQRLSKPFWKELPSAQEAGDAVDRNTAIKNLADTAARMLHEVGINMNMAPVLDISGPASDGVLRGRCFGNSADSVAEAGRIYIKTLQRCGIAAVAKHFPGIGMVQADPHLKRPVVESSHETIQEQLEPFREAVNAGVSSVMTSHVIFREIHNDVPATFSKRIAQTLLRDALGFSGVLMTDDLEMGGITRYASVEESALQAFKAGHDMLLVCHSKKLIRNTVLTLDDACKKGEITTDRLDASLARVEALKKRFFD